MTVSHQQGEPTPQVTLEDLAPREIDLDLLVVGNNPRSDSTWDTKDLAKSIKEHGVLQPIAVRPLGDGKFEIVAGARRYEAARIAKLKTIPAVARVATDEVAFVQALVENLQRSDLLPLDEARAFQHLVDGYNMTQEALGKQVGRSQPYIANALRLLELEPEVQEQVQSGKISVGHAKAIMSLPAERQKQLAQTIVDEKIPVTEVASIVRREKDQADRQTKYEQAKEAGGQEAVQILKDAHIKRSRVVVFHNKDQAEAVRQAGYSATVWEREFTQDPVYECKCDGLLYNHYDQPGKERLTRICLVRAHYDAFVAEANAKQEEERKANDAILKEARKMLAARVVEEPGISSRLLLYLMLGDPTVASYGGSNDASKFVKRHKGDPAQGYNGLWDTIAKMEPKAVLKETVDIIVNSALPNVFAENAKWENARTYRLRDWLVNTVGLNPSMIWGGHEPPSPEMQADINASAGAEMAGKIRDSEAPTPGRSESPTERRERDPAQIQDVPGEGDKEQPSTEGNPEKTPAEEASF